MNRIRAVQAQIADKALALQEKQMRGGGMERRKSPPDTTRPKRNSPISKSAKSPNTTTLRSTTYDKDRERETQMLHKIRIKTMHERLQKSRFEHTQKANALQFAFRDGILGAEDHPDSHKARGNMLPDKKVLTRMRTTVTQPTDRHRSSLSISVACEFTDARDLRRPSSAALPSMEEAKASKHVVRRGSSASQRHVVQMTLPTAQWVNREFSKATRARIL